MEGYFIKNNQKLSILILIPMLILSFILTFKSKPIDNNAKSTIYNYIECINKKDLASISKLVTKDRDIRFPYHIITEEGKTFA